MFKIILNNLWFIYFSPYVTGSDDLNNGRGTQVTRSAKTTAPSLQDNDIKGLNNTMFLSLYILRSSG